MIGKKMLHLFLAVAFSQTITCPTYQCSSLSNLQCVYFDGSTLSYYIEPCASTSSPYCPALTQLNSTCTEAPTPSTPKLYPGDKCEQNTDCLLGTCIKGYCTGAIEGGACAPNLTQNAECDPGLFCNTGGTPSTCLKLFLEGESCTSNSECIYGTGCYNLETCKKLVSLKPGTIIATSECVNLKSKYCESQQCHIFPNNTAVCTEALKSAYDVPIRCTSDSACVSKRVDAIGSAGQGVCQCGKNQVGRAYCSMFNGDGYMKKYLDKLADYYRSSSKDKCNIDAIMTTGCMKSFWGVRNYYEFVYYQYMAENYIDMYHADECTVKVFFSQYDEVKDNFDEVNESSFAQVVALVAGLYWI